ncbi:hypothetical protein [Paraburkholderia oxyphila]|uniref:hypothetical protein n=1 Tax=Paraburkholderia oxyphila TaxID=614212 RepID=UPI00069449F7|nr:hypothetical protein [Paraburkholderia oxyphila]
MGANVHRLDDLRNAAQAKKHAIEIHPAGIDSAGGGGDDGGMESRVKALEDANLETRDRLARIETRFDTLATKADLSDLRGAVRADLSDLRGTVGENLSDLRGAVNAGLSDLRGATSEGTADLRAEFRKDMNAQTWKLVTFVCSFGSALVGATYFVARYVH